jgi:choline dehydrogenase-like flavoprotein
VTQQRAQAQAQERLQAQAIDGKYDYIIVGAGSAGCLLANRLSADPDTRVLILEAGGNDNWIWFHIPVGYLFAIGNPRSDWCFKTEPEPGLNGRALNYPRGKVIGGSSAINAMVYMRGQSADYDHWRQLGLAGWGWDDVLPFFKRHENHFMGESAAHAVGGEWHIEAPRVRWDLLDAFRAAAEQAGIKSVSDFNCGDNEGCCAFHVNQKRGRRVSAAGAFLKPVLKRANLRKRSGAQRELPR